MDLIIPAISLGILSSLHCVGMCGPLALALPLDRTSKNKRYAGIFLYHFGKLLSYLLLGGIVGLFGKHIPLADSQQRLSIFAGIIILVFALYPLLMKRSGFVQKMVYKSMQPIQKALAKRLKTQRQSTIFSLGVLNGLLPCAMVYMALVGALATGQMHMSMAFMLFFALGTLPAMLSIQIFGASLGKSLRYKIQKLMPFALTLIGVFFILRGLGLGIEFISPNTGSLTVINPVSCD